jgi:hypothetical protein
VVKWLPPHGFTCKVDHINAHLPHRAPRLRGEIVRPSSNRLKRRRAPSHPMIIASL